jgi:hypothetical protein
MRRSHTPLREVLCLLYPGGHRVHPRRHQRVVHGELQFSDRIRRGDEKLLAISDHKLKKKKKKKEKKKRKRKKNKKRKKKN